MNDINDRPWRFVMIGRMIVVRLVFAIFMAEAVMLLWNLLLPSLVHVSPVSYWQALGLLVLARLLTGRIGGWQGRRNWPGRWQKMSDEERTAFRDEWRKRRS